MSANRSLTVLLDELAWAAIKEEATREGVSTEELVAFSVLYYIADIDSGRISRQISRSPYPALSDESSRRPAGLPVHPVIDRG